MTERQDHVVLSRNPGMVKLVRMLLASLFVCMLGACTSQSLNKAAGLQITGLVIENQSQMWVSAAQLLVPITGMFVSCGNIPPQSRCSTGFPETDYSGNPVKTTWSQAGQIHSTAEFVLELPKDLDIEKPAVVRVVITAPGSAGAVIVQKSQTKDPR